MIVLLFLLQLVASDVPASAQARPGPIQDGGIVKVGGQRASWYESVYGKPVHWSLRDMERGVVPPEGQAFWTQGLLLTLQTVRLCVEDETFCIPLVPVPEIGDVFQDAPVRAGDVAKVVGVVAADPIGSAPLPSPPAEAGPRGPQSAGRPPGRVGPTMSFWSFESGPDFARGPGAGAASSLEALVLHPDRFEGKAVTVEGRFRGGNLFEDLPPETRGRPSDWVLRDGPFSVWVTGRPPRGKGWRLDLASRADAGWRVQVEARVLVRGDLVLLEAREVRLLRRDEEPEP